MRERAPSPSSLLLLVSGLGPDCLHRWLVPILDVLAYAGCVMSARIQIVVDELEREAFRRAAAREGLSLSDWLRRAARARIESDAAAPLETRDELRAFFEECRRRERGREPDWSEHRAVMDESRASGRSRT